MKEYANRGIKEIIAEFPEVGSVLEEYGIGCGPCTIGVCRLKDVVEIHRLPQETEDEMIRRIEAVLAPDKNMPATPFTTRGMVSPERKEYSIPIQILVDEHKLIKRWLALIPAIATHLDLASADDRQTAEKGVQFIRIYADRLHHGKEEGILFSYFDDTVDIFEVIYEDHRRARALVQEMVSALNSQNTEVFTSNLQEYADLLTEHIHKENEILFPWLDSRLTEKEHLELVTRFEKSDRNLVIDDHAFRSFVKRLEQQMNG
ncbi:hemerythrin domain-containing protein [Desulfopila sp. IMCC35008]|uniref:hemerythrin domain-containing protein n=1 Tax=Desulfopila sp. IMCC35008 TaxID=2653858 RepID=UPI0013D67171|nr:hemerythrin domain-containing protein [Desulfopila sp. IMCC35008]